MVAIFTPCRPSRPAQHLAAEALAFGEVAFEQADALGGGLGRGDAVLRPPRRAPRIARPRGLPQRRGTAAK